MKPTTVLLNFLNFFAIFFKFLRTGWVGTEYNGNFDFFPFLSVFQPVLAWNEAVMEFFNFLNIFAVIMEFSLTFWEGTKRSGNFYFLAFSEFSNLFWLGMEP